MKFQKGSYTGNGGYQEIATAFDPELIIIAAFSKYTGFFTVANWVERTNAFAAILSQSNAVALTSTGFAVGTGGNSANSSNSNANDNGVTYYWFAVAGWHDQSLEISSSFGNGINPRTIDLQTQKTPIAALFKRDTAQEALLRFFGFSQGQLTTGLGGATTSSTTAYILSAGTGTITVDNNNGVNQLGGQFGEACTHMAFFGAANFAIVEWLGDGTTSRNVVANAGFAIQAALVVQANGARAMRVKTADMAGGLAFPVSNSATALPNDLVIAGSALQTGSATNCNQSGLRYYALLFGPDDGVNLPRQTRVPATARGTGRKYVSLPGRGVLSAIDCGADDSLKIDGAISIELMVRAFYVNPGEANPPAFNWMIGRSAGTLATSGNVSYGIGLTHMTDGTTQGLSGPQIVPAVTDYQAALNYAGAPSNVATSFRTGLLPPRGNRWMHLVLTHLGAGKWWVFMNGRLAKQRDIDMLTNGALSPSSFSPNIRSGAGHRLMFGARWVSGSSYADPLRMDLARARIYARGLSISECVALYDRFGRGNTGTPDVPGFREEWDANDASGSTLPAKVNAANNGSIINGLIGAMN